MTTNTETLVALFTLADAWTNQMDSNTLVVRYYDFERLQVELSRLQSTAPAQPVRVKALEWSNDRAGDYLITSTYRQAPKAYLLARGSSILGYFDLVADAKVAAQSDHEERILAAIETVPAPVQEAEPVAFTSKLELRRVANGNMGRIQQNHGSDLFVVPLYAAPPPPPDVRAAIEALEPFRADFSGMGAVEFAAEIIPIINNARRALAALKGDGHVE